MCRILVDILSPGQTVLPTQANSSQTYIGGWPNGPLVSSCQLAPRFAECRAPAGKSAHVYGNIRKRLVPAVHGDRPVAGVVLGAGHLFDHVNQPHAVSRNAALRPVQEMEVVMRARFAVLSRQQTTQHNGVNPFTPKSDQVQISPAASPEIWHHTVWRTWLFIAYSDERWLYYQFSLPHLYIFSIKGEMYFLISGLKVLRLRSSPRKTPNAMNNSGAASQREFSGSCCTTRCWGAQAGTLAVCGQTLWSITREKRARLLRK